LSKKIKEKSGKKEIKMLDFEIISEKILHIKKLIKNPKELIKSIEENDKNTSSNEAIPQWSEWNASTNSSIVFGKIKKANSSNIEKSSKETKNIHYLINKSINEGFQLYRHKIDKRIGQPGEFGIGKYFLGKEMGSHIDVDPNEKFKNFLFSGVIYLNSNYLGGELYFKNQNVLIKPSEGDMIIFPSVSPFFHESKQTILGSKYICTVFSF
jgi:hypothetical protein